MIAFLLFAAGATLTGRAILRVARVAIDDEIAWLIAPSIGLAAAALALGVVVALGIPVRLAAAPFWCVVAAAAVYTVWSVARPNGAAAAGLAAAGFFTLSLMATDVRQGLTDYVGSPVGDGWSYVAFGNYLWEVPKGTAGSLPPLQQYASHLASTRHVASALLAALSPLANGGGDTQSAVGPLLAGLLFVFGAAAMAIGRLVGLRSWRVIMVGQLAVWSPWLLGAVQLHNYDNLVALSFAPAILTVVRSAGPPRSVAILAALLFSGAIYTYVELSAISFLVLVFSGLRRVLVDRGRGWLAAAVAGGLVFAVCLAPIAPSLLSFVGDQVSVASGALGLRPGEGAFPELTRLGAWPQAYWRLIDVAALRFGAVLAAAAWICVTALVAGLLILGRRGWWDVAALLIVTLVAAGYFAAGQHYGYAAYKFLLICWWVVAVALVATVDVVRQQRRGGAIAAALLGLMFVTAVGANTLMRMRHFQQRLEAPSIAPYRHVRDLIPQMAGRPVVIDVKDSAASLWAVYFLRDQPIRLVTYRGYMALPKVAALMDRAAQPSIGAIKLLLTDRSSVGDSIAVAGPYALRDFPTTKAR